MKPAHPAFSSLLLAVLMLSATAPAQSAQLKPGVAAVTALPAAEPVQRLIIRYRAEALKTERVAATSTADERATAAAQVARSAERAQAGGVRYLKSVSSQQHVVRLDRAVTQAEAQALLDRLQADPEVEAVAVDRLLRPHALTVPTDPYFTSAGPYRQWHLQSSATVPGGINAASAWERSDGSGVTVAVLDGGYRPHLDLAAKLLTGSGYDFISDIWTANDGDGLDANAEDPGDWVPSEEATTSCPAENSSWHGTHVSGLIAALANASEGVGVAHGARVLPVRVLGRCGGFLSDIQAAMRWVAGLSVPGVPVNQTPVKVINLSLGVQENCDSTTQQVVNEVRARGLSVVASTGNDGLTAITKPANCSGVLAVTAHTYSGSNAGYANVGTGTRLSAPGGDATAAIASTWNAGTTVPGADSYGLLYGTSMAAPQVVGVLALMASLRPDLSMATLEGILLANLRPFPAGDYCTIYSGDCGAGLLDAQAAVAAAETYTAPVSDGGGGGGCTVASGGQADAGLPLLALLAAGGLLWRRRRAAG